MYCLQRHMYIMTICTACVLSIHTKSIHENTHTLTHKHATRMAYMQRFSGRHTSRPPKWMHFANNLKFNFRSVFLNSNFKERKKKRFFISHVQRRYIKWLVAAKMIAKSYCTLFCAVLNSIVCIRSTWSHSMSFWTLFKCSVFDRSKRTV